MAAHPPRRLSAGLLRVRGVLWAADTKVENDDLNRRASAMSIELVRRRSSINYDNLPVNRV